MTLKEDNILQNALAVMREKLSMTEDLMRVERLDSATGSMSGSPERDPIFRQPGYSTSAIVGRGKQASDFANHRAS